MDIYELENPLGIIPSMGGQLPNNIAMNLHHENCRILGTSPESIDGAENRYKFSRMLDMKEIDQPEWRELTDINKAKEFCKEAKYPCIVRPSYVLSGAGMIVATNDDDLETYLKSTATVNKDHPVVISKYIVGAKEIDVDAVAQDGELICMAVSEHVENAGVHSGDATLVTPPQDLNKTTLSRIKEICSKIGRALSVNGPYNMQLIAKDNQLSVIECNLRVSRSFPFVSKTLNFDFVALATRVIMGERVSPIDITLGNPFSIGTTKVTRVGVKVPQFSFSRLSGADVALGVEMTSTGEVACFGENRYEAYLKALISTGFRIPKRKVAFLSIGSFEHKAELLTSIRMLHSMGYKLYASLGTADYYNYQDIPIEAVKWPFEEIGNETTSTSQVDRIVEYLATKEFDLLINLPMRSKGARRVSTLGYRTRRFAVDHSVPLISDVKCAKLLVQALRLIEGSPKVKTHIDCLTARNIVRLPGLIDVHVHLREPGETEKEDFDSGTAAAIAGGITMICVMPNTIPPIVDEESLLLERKLAKAKARCDYGLFLGATSSNAESIAEVAQKSHPIGLKMYLNNTYGQLCLPSVTDWIKHFDSWPKNLPVVVHAEGQTTAAVILLASLKNRSVHICHVAREEEILIIKSAKEANVKVTCEVCPQHLFLCDEDVSTVGVEKSAVKPPLVTKRDQTALWENLDVIDCFATDHAPHLIAHKLAKNVPGYPGLETILPLLLTAVNENRLTLEEIIQKMYTNPKKIFNLPDQYYTYIEIDLDETWTIPAQLNFTKANWTPFAGRAVKGKIRRVVLRGEVAFIDGQVLVPPGFGQEAFPLNGSSKIPNKMQKYPTELESNKYTSTIKESDKNVVSEIYTQMFQDLRFSEASKIKSLESSPTVSSVSSSTAQPLPAAPSTSLTPQILFPHDVVIEDTTLAGKHILSADIFTPSILHSLFNSAQEMKKMLRSEKSLNILGNKFMATIFYEESTRTRVSFTSAMERLGGRVINLEINSSSTKKGETLEDTITTMASYCDILVVRHSEVGAVKRAAKVSRKPVINGGDGVGEHPTQALLDVFTIREEIGTVNGLTITLVGDLKNGRTTHSLAKLLTHYNVNMLFVSPLNLRIPEEIKEYLHERNIQFQEHQSLEAVLLDTDVLYMTRIQKERFSSEDEYQQACGHFIVTPKLMTKAKKKMIVMHPLPRVDEIK